MAGRRSVTFPPLDERNFPPAAPGQPVRPAPPEPAKQDTEAPLRPRSLLGSLYDLRRASKTIHNFSSGLPDSATRHGDLQIIRSAALRVIESADVLIAAEEL